MALLNIIFDKTKTQIGTITVDAAVSLKHSLSSSLTKNPVEEGAKVTDHVELEPQGLSIQGVISDTPLDFQVLNDLVNGNFKNIGKSFKDGIKSSLGKTSRSIEQYQAIVELWKSREPFQVITGFKVYDSMILTKFEVDQNATTGRAMHFTAEMEQIRIVSSQGIAGSLGGGLGGAENLADGVKDIGSKTKNLGSKVTEKLDPVQDVKKAGGSSKLFDMIANGG